MKHPIIRTIYLYLFALVGLAMVVTGTARLVNVGLKAWIFTEADKQEVFERAPVPARQLDATTSEAMIKEVEVIDYTVRNRQRDLAGSLSAIIVGLPLYLYHWGVIKRDNRKKKEDKV